MKLVIHTDWLRVYDDVLSKSDCNKIIQFGQKLSFTDSTVVGQTTKKSTYRTSSHIVLPESLHQNLILSKIVEKASGYDAANQEPISLLKYKPGQQYRPHPDYFDEHSETGREQMKGLRNRVMTALLFLNDNFTGGQTQFYNDERGYNPEITVHPKRGRLILWMNMNIKYNFAQVTKRKNIISTHAGLPVIEGTKHCAVIWIRESLINKEPTNETY
tara:strand:+ start:1393 stop:2040 length:648 start_codon:yes stop_codon:yes gene_type:complete